MLRTISRFADSNKWLGRIPGVRCAHPGLYAAVRSANALSRFCYQNDVAGFASKLVRYAAGVTTTYLSSKFELFRVEING